MSQPRLETWTAPDGTPLRLRGWPAASPAKTVLIAHHGLGEHGGRYATFAEQLRDEPLHVWSFDLRGHGESGGKRGDAAGLEQLASDLEALIPVLLERAGAERAIVLGHSLGAASVGTWLTTRTPHPAVAAVMLSAAPLRVARTPAVRFKARLGRVLRRVAPTLALGNAIPPETISSDPSQVARYLADPLNHDRLSVRLGLSLLEDAPRILERAGAVTLPALIWHGLDDRLVDAAGSRDLFEALGSPDKTLLQLEGYRHEPHHETPERVASLFGRIRDWLRPRLA